MDSLQELQDNLNKIKDLDIEIEELKQKENTSNDYNLTQDIDYSNLELQLLINEYKYQQEISKKLSNENEKLKEELQAQKKKYDQIQIDFTNFQRELEEATNKEKQLLQAQQKEDETTISIEEKRLQQSLLTLQEKHNKLLEEQNKLQSRLAKAKSKVSPKKKVKKSPRQNTSK